VLNKKQEEALVIAMFEKGESNRDIAQKAKVSPNTIKAISSRLGLDETTFPHVFFEFSFIMMYL
jgi:hypothetical protein